MAPEVLPARLRSLRRSSPWLPDCSVPSPDQMVPVQKVPVREVRVGVGRGPLRPGLPATSTRPAASGGSPAALVWPSKRSFILKRDCSTAPAARPCSALRQLPCVPNLKHLGNAKSGIGLLADRDGLVDIIAPLDARATWRPWSVIHPGRANDFERAVACPASSAPGIFAWQLPGWSDSVPSRPGWPRKNGLEPTHSSHQGAP